MPGHPPKRTRQKPVADSSSRHTRPSKPHGHPRPRARPPVPLPTDRIPCGVCAVSEGVGCDRTADGAPGRPGPGVAVHRSVQVRAVLLVGCLADSRLVAMVMCGPSRRPVRDVTHVSRGHGRGARAPPATRFGPRAHRRPWLGSHESSQRIFIYASCTSVL